jgi:DNA-directed RNA polymerase subunit RPC12/RpoP
MLYEFVCNDCDKPFEEFTSYDPSGQYEGLFCPACGSSHKTKKISLCHLQGTDSRMNVFSNRAGRLMERAKGERRAAESGSHMGTNPYTAIDDTPLDTGIHDNEAPIRL